jgi:EmrB/QacA subfamily drug resistance transporter
VTPGASAAPPTRPVVLPQEGRWTPPPVPLPEYLRPTPAPVPEVARAPVRRGLTLVVVCTAIFMLVLDVTIVSVALADLQRDLRATLADLQWVVDAYTLALAGGLLTAATLGDRIGRKRIFAAGLAIFSGASLACAVAGSVAALDAARAVQGLGASLLFGTALPLLGAAFPDVRGRARAVGAFGAAMSAATAVGPLAGGALVDGPGWRWIFLVNVPVGLTGLAATLWLTESRPQSARRADWPGAVLLTAGLLALLLALIRGNGSGWASAPILGLFAAAAVLLAAFFAREATAVEPMFDLGLLRRPVFAGVAVQAFALTATLVAATFYLALYLQNTLGFSPWGTGLRVLPLTVAAFAAAPATSAALHRIGVRLPLALGLLAAGDGLALIAFGASLPGDDPGHVWLSLVPGLVLAGLGLGSGLAASASAALSAVGPERAGMATGTITTIRQVGLAAGVAALGALFEHRAGRVTLPTVLPPAVRGRLADAIASGAGVRAAEALPPQLPSAVRAAAVVAARSASTQAIEVLCLVAGAAAVVSGLVCMVLLGLLPARDRE